MSTEPEATADATDESHSTAATTKALETLRDMIREAGDATDMDVWDTLTLERNPDFPANPDAQESHVKLDIGDLEYNLILRPRIEA